MGELQDLQQNIEAAKEKVIAAKAKTTKWNKNKKNIADAEEEYNDAVGELEDYLELHPEEAEGVEIPGEIIDDDDDAEEDAVPEESEVPVIHQNGHRVNTRSDLYLQLNKDKIVIHQKGKPVAKAEVFEHKVGEHVIAQKKKAITGSQRNIQTFTPENDEE